MDDRIDPEPTAPRLAGRGYHKLTAAMDAFGLDPTGWVCADLGCNVGGFVDCLLRRGASKVYAVDTGYGALDYRLRRDPRVVVMERTNAMHVRLPEPVNLVTIDVGWTRQKHILRPATTLLTPGGLVISLVKPHYEADRRQLRNGVLPAEDLEPILQSVRSDMNDLGMCILGQIESPLPGHGGNREVLMLLSVASA